ncbi:MAG: methyltransferase [Oscillospiraceae bacterium]|nr:methyltransferase [Oscillospiraceae bacterium]
MQDIRGTAVRLTAVGGVFANKGRMDRASLLLVRRFSPSLPAAEGSLVLDVGCGYGAIGVCVAAIHKGLRVHMTDVNRRALEYASMNARENGADAEAFESDLYGDARIAEGAYSDILSNPPMAAGRAVCRELVTGSVRYLRVGGSLWLTAYHNKGGRYLRDLMGDVYGDVAEVAKEGGVRVYRSVRGGIASSQGSSQ